MRRLEAAGCRVHAVPTVATERLDFPPPDLDRFDWVVVTSAEGARGLLERTPPGRARWAAVGPATAAALAQFGVSAEVVPEERRGLRLADALAAVGGLAGRRVLLAGELVRRGTVAPPLPE